MPADTLTELGGEVRVKLLPEEPELAAITALVAAVVGAATPTVQLPLTGDVVGHTAVVAAAVAHMRASRQSGMRIVRWRGTQMWQILQISFKQRSRRPSHLMYAAPLLLDAEDESSADELLLAGAHSDDAPAQPLRTLSQQRARPRPSVGGTHLTELLSQSYAERVERERKPPEPSLHSLRLLCPLLARCLWFSGLAQDAGPTVAFLSRPVRAGGVLLLSLFPLVPGALLPECSSLPHGSAAACVSRSTSWLYLLVDAAFTSFLLAAGPPLVATLSEVLEDASAVSKDEVTVFARRTTRLLLLLFALLWALLPLAGLLQAATHAAGVGDVVTRWLWLVAGPARAALMTAVTTSLVVTLRLHSLPLKAIRAAARLREHDAPARSARQLVEYYAALLSAYQHSLSLLSSTSVRLQRLVAVLLLFGIQNLFAMLVFYYSSAGAFQMSNSGAIIGNNATAVPSPSREASFAQDVARQYDVLEELVHCGAFVFMALAALGMAAHLTSLCDATGRALRAGLGHGLASVLAGTASLAAPEQLHAEEGGAEPPRMPGDVANDAALLSALVANAADAGGFRIVGSRVTFAWFSLMLTLSLGVANFGLSTAKSAPASQGASPTG